MFRWRILSFSLFLATCEAVAVSRNLGTKNSQNYEKFTIQMIGYQPTKTDDYVAVSREAVPGYIVGFEPVAHADRVHHMLLYGCTEPARDSGFWRGQDTCSWTGGSYILYAWARNAPDLDLPQDVAFSIGHENDGIKYFVLQVHYAAPFDGEIHDFSGVTLHLTQQKPANLAAVLLFVGGTPIPPALNQFQSNMSCNYESRTDIHPFAFRTHTHAMGRAVSAFFKHNGVWTKIGHRNPQWPQLFESIPDKLTITKNDLMAASCRFDSHDKTVTVRMGAMGIDEMCNFYMMYYYDSNQENPYPRGAVCGGLVENSMKDYPTQGFSLLSSHPELEHHAHQSKTAFGIVQVARHTKIEDVPLGQVSGLSFDNQGNLIVFHRAHRVWGADTFDQYNVLSDKTPIKDDVILVVSYSGNSTKIVKKLGKNQFYMPHGIYVDKEGLLYTTDVGSHTVAKWRIDGNDLVKVWENGEILMPDSDDTHFCKPTGVVRVGDRIFVSDGYCNSRVVILDLNGKRIGKFGLPGIGPTQFELPHDIVANDRGNLLIADRENGRVQELTTEGKFVGEYRSSLFSNVYSADAFGNYVYMVPGRASENHASDGIAVFAGRAGKGLVEFAFGPSQRGPRETVGVQFGQPHSLRLCPDGDNVFIGDIAQGKATLWHFKIQHDAEAHAPLVSQKSAIVAPSRAFSITLVFFAAAICTIGFFVISKRCKNLKNAGAGFDKKGFKPLRTEETVGFISDGSESD